MGKEHEQSDLKFEGEIIDRFKNGDQRAFSDLVCRYQKRIFRLALGFFHDRDDALDIVQETFLRIHEKISQYDENTRFSNWIYRIAMNLCIDYYRKFKKKPEKIRGAVVQIINQGTEPPAEPEDCFDRLRNRERLRESLHRLPNRQKRIFVLKHYGNYRYREIADILNVSEGCVKALHHRSVNKLKKKFLQAR